MNNTPIRNHSRSMARPFYAIAAAALGFSLAASGHELPADYTLIDYIEAKDGQYLDTGIIGAAGIKVRIDFAWTDDGSLYNDDWTMLGSRNGDTRFFPVHLCYQQNLKDSGPEMVSFGFGTFYRTTAEARRNVRHEVVADLSNAAAIQIYTNSVNVYSKNHSGSSGISTGRTMFLFAANIDGSVKQNAKGRVYGLRIMQKNGSGGFDIVRDYIPAKNPSGVAGLFDKVLGEFSTSQTAIPFTAGAELPRPASLVEWVESDGNGPSSSHLWIDTEVIARSGLRSDIDFALKDNPASDTDRGILSSRGAHESDTRFYLAYHFKGNFVYGYQRLFHNGADNANEKAAVVPAAQNTRYRIVSNLSTNFQSVTVNGAELHKDGVPYKADYFTTGNPLTLFCYSETGSRSLFSAVRLYSLKISDGDEPLRDYIPCIADNNKAGLYDRVSERVFFPKAGTSGAAGSFNLESAVGPVTNSPTATPPTARYAYIQADGTDDYIDLGIVAKDGTKMFAEMEWVSILSDRVFCGARKDDGNTRFFLYSSYQNVQRYGYAADNPTVKKNGEAVTQRTGVRYRVTSQFEAGAQTISIQRQDNGAWVDDAANADTSAGPVDTGLPLYLFARNKYGEVADCFCAARVYSLKLWQKDGNGDYQLVRNLVPAKTSDDEAALWDRVSETWFRNGGTGALSHGAEQPLEDGLIIRFW